MVPCNVDIATTEALSMALEVDPEGDRTIGERRKLFPRESKSKRETRILTFGERRG